MRFWDTSAVVPLLTVEAGTSSTRAVLEDDSEIIVWWGARVECTSALARYGRDETITGAEATRARERLAMLAERWSEILPSEPLREIAERILRTHVLDTAGALRLAAAVVASDGRPGGLPFVSLDERQREAARREGFVVLPDTLPRPRAGGSRTARGARPRRTERAS